MPQNNDMAKIDKQLVGVRLKKVRKDLKLRQLKVCGDLNVPQSNVSLYETGETMPSINYLLAFAQKYNVSLYYLLGLSEEMQDMDIFKLLSDGKVTISKDDKGVILTITDKETAQLLEDYEKDVHKAT